MIVVDTNVWSETLRLAPEQRVLSWLRQHEHEVVVTSVTVGELLFGARRLAPGRRRDELLRGVERLMGGAAARVLPYDRVAAEEFARLRAAREARGRVVSVEDTMIAGVCLSRGYDLATRNTRDFDDTGVELHNPWG
ncbi:MAG: type II toxin-antitoxin system VapC family toxin [Aeromicrobium sp.]|uniref:type II toxin-antitoxin system VapC family toxin n=1 Tax=Aeromicrobium sp. TaxID=1871063 RepID=UPI0039E2B429